ncbi:MAG: HigA family addiction module antidote protein [Desulfomonile tiedjei]|nr:HigA family addiction module antidote protein [Desulfomonile tiedjei]
MKEAKLPPIHPGEILFEEFMEPLGLNQRQLAQALGVNVTRINRIIKGKSAITADTALRLGRYFGTTAQLWLNMQSRYDLEKAKDESEAKIKKAVKPRTKSGISVTAV